MADKTKKKTTPKPKSKTAGKPKAKAKSKPKAKAKAKATRKPRAQCHDQLVTIKVTKDEQKLIHTQASKLAEGNVSRFLRHAARVCKTKAPEIPKKAA